MDGESYGDSSEADDVGLVRHSRVVVQRSSDG